MTTTVAVAENRAAELHASSIVIDGLSFYYDGPSGRTIPHLLTATNLTACETYANWPRAINEIAKVRADMKGDPATTLIRSASDIESAKAAGKVGIILGVQSTLFIETEIERFEILHDIGLRIIQITYNERCYIGDGCLEGDDGGLTRFGKRAIAEMGRLGIAVDLSHVGRRTSVEAIHESPVPVMFTHANPDALTRNPRNLTDEQIEAIGERGGLIGLCAWLPLCWKNNRHKKPDLDDFIDHIVYVADKIGIDHVGIGTDSPFTENQAWIDQHNIEFGNAYPETASEYKSLYPGETKPWGIHNLHVVTEGLLGRGFSEDETRKVIGGNFLRHFRDVWRG